MTPPPDPLYLAVEKFLYLQHVAVHIFFFARVAEKHRGMVYRRKREISLFDELTVLRGDAVNRSHCSL